MAGYVSMAPSLADLIFVSMLQTPRIPVWGGLMTGVKASQPMEPRLETVKVAPWSLSGAMAPSLASAARALHSMEISSRDFFSALKMVGTSRPRGVSQAKPRWTCLKRRTEFSSMTLAFRSPWPRMVRETAKSTISLREILLMGPSMALSILRYACTCVASKLNCRDSWAMVLRDFIMPLAVARRTALNFTSSYSASAAGAAAGAGATAGAAAAAGAGAATAGAGTPSSISLRISRSMTRPLGPVPVA